MRLPARVAVLRSLGAEILFSVGAGGTNDFTNIGNLLNGQLPRPGNPLYDNFSALKRAILAGGGDIDGIDFDNEDYPDVSVMVNFGRCSSRGWPPSSPRRDPGGTRTPSAAAW